MILIFPWNLFYILYISLYIYFIHISLWNSSLLINTMKLLYIEDDAFIYNISYKENQLLLQKLVQFIQQFIHESTSLFIHKLFFFVHRTVRTDKNYI